MENIERDLAKRIERVIHEFLGEHRAAAAVAVERGFAVSVRAATGHKRPATRKAAAEHRTSAEIEAIRERFLQAVQRQPGETMKTLAGALGEGSPALHRYATRLKDRGLIRTVGKLQSTRYFPMVMSAATAS